MNLNRTGGVRKGPKAGLILIVLVSDFPALHPPVALVNVDGRETASRVRADITGIEGRALEPCHIVPGCASYRAPLAGGEVGCCIGSCRCRDGVAAIESVIRRKPCRPRTGAIGCIAPCWGQIVARRPARHGEQTAQTARAERLSS